MILPVAAGSFIAWRILFNSERHLESSINYGQNARTVSAKKQ